MNPRIFLPLALVALSASSSARSETIKTAAPRLRYLAPQGIQRAATAEIAIHGTRLADAEAILLYEPGITVKSVKTEKENLAKATVEVSPDCRLGLHALRLITRGGVSDLAMFSIGAFPEVAEAEPNSDFAAPQAIPPGTTISGVVANEDVDYFVVEAKKGDRLSAEVEGLRLSSGGRGGQFFDPYLAILNSERFELAKSDDASLLRQDAFCSLIAPEDGRYIIELRECAFGGSDNARYRLHVGTFPRPEVVFPPAGKAGEPAEFTFLGDPTGEMKTTATPVADRHPAFPSFPLYAQDSHGVSPSPNRIHVTDSNVVIEEEPNDNRKEPTPGAAPAAFCGVIGQPSDVDYFQFAAKKNQQFHIAAVARNTVRSPLDAVVNVYRASDNSRVGGADDGRGPDSYYRFRAPADDDYLIRVQDHLREGGPAYVYCIEVVPVAPRLALALPERERYESTTLNVPRGNRMALLVDLRREDFGGDLTLAFEGLPPGVSAEIPPIPADRNQTPVVFTAQADAAPAGSLVDLVAKPTDEKFRDVVGHIEQRTMLIRGQNNRDVWGHDAFRMAAAVTDEAPFHLEIAEPKAPVVRNGSKRIKVIAKKADGWDAPIRLQMLYNPPGIGSSAAIVIRPKQTEAEIPVTCNGGAPEQTWKICVTGKATVGGGPLEVATPFTDLAVADTFFDLAVGKASGEQGTRTQLEVAITHKTPFEGEAEARLVGLPGGVKTQPLKFTKDTPKLVFDIDLAENARPGRHTGVRCLATFTMSGEEIVQTQGPGELRVDKPLSEAKSKK